MPTVEISATIGDLASLGPIEHMAAVVGPDQVLLGAVSPTALRLPGETAVRQIMISAPGTMRPDLRIDEAAERLRKDHLDHSFVTTTSGVLLGMVITKELHA